MCSKEKARQSDKRTKLGLTLAPRMRRPRISLEEDIRITQVANKIMTRGNENRTPC